MNFLAVWWNLRKVRSGDPKVRAAAIERLGKIASPRAVERLCTVLTDDQRALRAAAAQALGNIRHSRAVGPLVTCLLAEKQWDVRYEIVDALRKIGDPTAVNELLVVLDNDNADVSLQQVTTWALKEFGWEHLTPAQQALVLILRDEWPQIVSLGPAAIGPIVMAIRKGTNRLRRDATQTLAKINDPRAFTALIELLKCPEADIRQAAADALEKHAWDRLNPEQSSQVAVNLRKWAVVIGFGPAAIGPLLEALQDPDPAVRGQVLKTLAVIGGPRAAKAIADALRDRDVSVRRTAAAALARFDGPADVEPLKKALADEDIGVREAAAASLTQRGWNPADPKDRVRFAFAAGRWADAAAIGVDAVGPLVENLHHPTLRTLTLEALVKIGAPAVEPLLKVLKEPTTILRLSAAEALGQLRDERAIPALEKTLDDAEPSVRVAAHEALQSLGWTPPTPKRAAEVAIALENWEEVPAIGAPAVAPLLAAMDAKRLAPRALHAIEQILHGDRLSEVPVPCLQKLATFASAPATGVSRQAASTGSAELQSAVARRRVGQLARQELQRRRLPV